MSLIIQFLTILLVAFMAQRASSSKCDQEKIEKIEKDAKERSELQNQTVHLYCFASYLHSTFGPDNKFPQNIQVSEISINKTRLRALFDVLSDECKSFIRAFSLKQHFQEYLFNEANPNEEVIKTIYSVLVYLQAMADLWDSIEFINNSSRCVSLTETEYKMMYFMDYDSKDLLYKTNTSASEWFTDENYYTKHLSSLPSVCTCNILYPSLDIF